MKTVCSCLAQVRRGAEKWFQFKWVCGSPNPRLQGFLPQIRRTAMSGFMHCYKAIMKRGRRGEVMGGKATIVSFYFRVGPHSPDPKEAYKLKHQKKKK